MNGSDDEAPIDGLVQLATVPFIYKSGRKGIITTNRGGLNHREICVEWSRFSLKQMCSLELEWNYKMIFLYCTLCLYYVQFIGMNYPVIVDMEPCNKDLQEMKEMAAICHGEHDVVTIFQVQPNSTKYILCTIDHTRKEAYIICCNDNHRKMSIHLSNCIMIYLKKNGFIQADCKKKDIKWPNKANNSVVQFTILRVKEEHCLNIADEKFNDKPDLKASTAVICQEIRRVIGIEKFDMTSGGYEACTTKCS